MKKQSDDDDDMGDWPEPMTIVDIAGAAIWAIIAISVITIAFAKIF